MAFCPHCGKRLEIIITAPISETQPEREPQQKTEPAPDPRLDEGIHILQLRSDYTRIANVLDRAGITTVRDLTHLTVDDLARLKNCGQKCINTIVDALDKAGLRLKDNGLSVGNAYTRVQASILRQHRVPKGMYLVNGSTER